MPPEPGKATEGFFTIYALNKKAAASYLLRFEVYLIISFEKLYFAIMNNSFQAPNLPQKQI